MRCRPAASGAASSLAASAAVHDRGQLRERIRVEVEFVQCHLKRVVLADVAPEDVLDVDGVAAKRSAIAATSAFAMKKKRRRIR